MGDSTHDLPALPIEMPNIPGSTQVDYAARNNGPIAVYSDERAEMESLLKELPHAEDYKLESDRLRHMPDGTKELGWQSTLKLVEKHDRDLCQAYREQIDTLLVFAGLFSAVVTAFAVESYQWLRIDPADTSVELLRDMVVLLSQNMNTTLSPVPRDAANISDASVTRINVLWFMSLTLSLSAALIAILCKQWLREFERDVGQSPETALAVRHIRFQGLEYWNVGSIITSVPLMLQLALALFLAGAVDLLWQLHTTVAGCVTVVAGGTLIFYLSTTLLPLAQYAYICTKCCMRPSRTGDYCGLKAFTEPQCAFKSAQAWLALRIAQPIIESALKAYAIRFTLHAPPDFHALVLRPAESWVTFDMNWMKRYEHVHIGPKCAYESLAWVVRNLEETQLSSWIWHCLWARWHRNRESHGSVVEAIRDISCVARAYPDICPIERQRSVTARAQAKVFQCSLRTDLPVNTALELILRITPHLGADSQWTLEALKAVIRINKGCAISLSDDISTGLFRLAEMQTRAIINGPTETAVQAPNPPYGTWSFYYILVLLIGGSRLAPRIIPGMAGLAVRWLREQPVSEHKAPAAGIASYVLAHYTFFDTHPARLRNCPGILLTARFISTFVDTWPDSAGYLRAKHPHHSHVVRELLAIASEHTAAPSTVAEGPQKAASYFDPSGEVSDIDDDINADPPQEVHGSHAACSISADG